MPPIYEYECQVCHGVTERKRSSEKRRNRAQCAYCSSWKTCIIISDTSFKLKGNGWYATDKGKKK